MKSLYSILGAGTIFLKTLNIGYKETAMVEIFKCINISDDIFMRQQESIKLGNY